MSESARPELIFGLVGPLGTDLNLVTELLKKSLEKVGYTSDKIILSDLLSEVDGLEHEEKNSSEYDRIESRMDRGDELRNRVSGDALAILSMGKIQELRSKKTGKIEKPITNHAYILKSLKHKDEATKLRKVYGNSFWLLSVFSSREIRIDSLAKQLGNPPEKYRSDAEKLVNRDYHDDEKKLGQDVRETFPEGDVFIDASHPKILEEQINRFVELVFGNTFHTPRREEYGMFHAFASSLRSSSLSRQVGAAILDGEGNLISTGTNEVPKAGGGVYGSDDDPKKDSREFIWGRDSNQEEKIKMLKDIFERLKKVKWLDKDHQDKSEEELVKDALKLDDTKDMQFLDVTEYGREVHAEMDALVSGARGTESVKDGILYCTTFPCHICAKHIVASGIKKVIFIEPYPKSHAQDLFPDSISVGEDKEDKVHFKPYFGIAPKRYVDLFKMNQRKDEATGKKIDWIASQSVPRFWESKEFANDESSEMVEFVKFMEQKGLKLKKG